MRPQPPQRPGFHSREASGPDNRFESLAVEYDEGVERPQAMRVYREIGKSILSRNESPDIPFRFSVNPYRGCAHACSYCYARPYHEYLGWGAGTDFDTRIVAKVNAPELLEKELRKPSWQGDSIVFSGVTDCYQPAESALKITRRCLEACLRYDTPVGLITKSVLVLRDLDILEELARGPGATAAISLPFLDATDARGMEPFAAPPEARFRALEKLSAAGVRTGVSISPIIPGWNDADIPKLLKRAADCGASFAFYTLLRLPGAVEPVFLERLRRDFPHRAGKVEHHLRETHGGGAETCGVRGPHARHGEDGRRDRRFVQTARSQERARSRRAGEHAGAAETDCCACCNISKIFPSNGFSNGFVRVR